MDVSRPIHNIRDLDIDPINPNTIYATTWGDRGAFYKSTDGGSNWAPLMSTMTTNYGRTLAIDPVSPNIIYAAPHRMGVHKSTDGGISWAQINNSPVSINAFVIDPFTSDTIYAGSLRGIFKSIDVGENWTQINNGLVNIVNYTLAIDPAESNIIYAGTHDVGIFKSIDRGTSWTPINNGVPQGAIYTLAIDPVTPNTIALGLSALSLAAEWSGWANAIFLTTIIPAVTMLPLLLFPIDHLSQENEGQTLATHNPVWSITRREFWLIVAGGRRGL